MPGGLEDPSDDDAYRPPLPPQDRVWRHPSELASELTADAPATASGTSTHVRSVLTLGATAALVVVAVVLVGGALELSKDHTATTVQAVRLTASSLHPTTLVPTTIAPGRKVLLGISAIDTAFGVRVTECVVGGAAAAAGLRAGDVLVTIGDDRVRRMSDVWAVLAQLTPGRHVTVSAVRDGQPIVLDIPLVARA